MTASTMANDDDKNERLCFACESEKLGHNPSNWCPRCKWMIRPHCVGFVPVNAFSEEDINSVNEILENNSTRATVSRLRDWHSRLDRQDSNWLFGFQQSQLESIVDDEKGKEIRQRILQRILDAENQTHKEWLMNRGVPLPGGFWLQFSSPPHMLHSITVDGVINTGPRFPSAQLFEMISKLDEWELKAINWHRFSQILAQLGENHKDWIRTRRALRRGGRGRFYEFMQNRQEMPARSNASVLAQIINRWTSFKDSWLQIKQYPSGRRQNRSDLETLPFLIDRMASEDIETIPWLNRWRGKTENWSSSDILEYEFTNLLSVRDGRLFVRAKSSDGKTKLRRVPTDIRLWSALISAQFSPPGSSIHDSLQLLLLNWNNERVTPTIPEEADRKAALLLADLENKNDNIYFSTKHRGLVIDGTTETQYLIKVNSRHQFRHTDKYNLSARVDPTDAWEPICTHASEQLSHLPIGDQIVTVALVCSNDKHNHKAIRTIHEFLVRKNKVDFHGPSVENPPYGFRLRNAEAEQRRIEMRYGNPLRQRQREIRERWQQAVQRDLDFGEIRFEQNHNFPLDDNGIGNDGDRNRIPNLLINALVGLHAAPVGAMARFPRTPGGSFRLLTIENEYQTEQEIEILRNIAQNHGWIYSQEMTEHHDVDEDQEIWVKDRHTRLNREALFDILTPVQDEIDPTGRQWWTRIEERVQYFRRLRHRAFWNFQNEER